MANPVVIMEAERVRGANRVWAKAQCARDMDGIMRNIADNVVLQAAGAKVVRGYEGVQEFYREFLKQPFTEFDASPDEIVIAGSDDLAVDIGKFYFVFKNGNGKVRSDGKYLAVWRKDDGNWKCIAISMSYDALVGMPVLVYRSFSAACSSKRQEARN